MKITGKSTLPIFLVLISWASNSVLAQNDTINRDGRWTSTATDGGTGPLGDPITLNWSFARDGQVIPVNANPADNRTSDLIGYLDTQWNVSAADQMTTDFASRPWFPRFRDGFERWGEVSGLSYQYEANDSGGWGAGGAIGARGDVRVAGYSQDGPFGTLAFNQFPNGGDMILDTLETTVYGPGSNTFFRNIISHEHGHGIGLSHTVSTVFLMNPSINSSFDGPQYHDILGAQRGYGDPLEKNGGNDTLATATSLGTIAINSTVGLGLDTPDVGDSPTSITRSQTDFVSIDGSSDNDFFKFTVDGRSQANFLINPRGPTYNIGRQNGGPGVAPFNGSQQSDLTFSVFDQNGIELSRVNQSGIGGNEQVAGFKLTEAGDYFVSVAGQQNAAQFYSIEATINNTPAVTDSNLVFRDTFNLPASEPGSNSNPNAFRQGGTRQGPGIVDSLLAAGSTDEGDTSVSIVNNALQLSSTGDGDGPNQAFVDLSRNFLPQVNGESWNLSFDVLLESELGVGDSWFGLTFNDDLPIGLPFSQSAEMAILLRQSGAYSVRENGGDLNPDEFNETGSVSSMSGLFNFSLLVDETGPDSLLSLFINGDELLSQQLVDLNDLGRFFSFRNHVGGSSPTGLSFTSTVDNVELRLVSAAVPEPTSLALLTAAVGCLVSRRRR